MLGPLPQSCEPRIRLLRAVEPLLISHTDTVEPVFTGNSLSTWTMSEQSNGAIPSGSLHAFFQSNKPQPQQTAISQEVRDRGSTFVAQLFEVSTPEEALARAKYVKNVMHSTKPAAHEVAAWRCMTIKEGRAGLDGVDDFELKSGSKDDGERWAGERVLKVMQNLAVIDAVVIVSRW